MTNMIQKLELTDELIKLFIEEQGERMVDMDNYPHTFAHQLYSFMFRQLSNSTDMVPYGENI